MGRNVKDITGMQFGYLTAVKFSHRKNGKTYWEFKCRCGNTAVRRVDKLKRCETPSCGCYSKEYCEYQKETAQKRRNIKNKIKIAQKEKKHREALAWRDLTGETIGNLTVLEMLGEQCGKRTIYKCLCDCGNEVNKSQGQLTTKSPCNSTWSCGCTKERHSNSEYANQNNLTTSRIYRIYKNMINRCYNSRNAGYKDYGARGITVCEEWLQDDGFEAFYKWAITHGYNDSLTIDRIDVNGNYEPSNCRWTDAEMQANNKRNSINIKYQDTLITIKECSEKSKIKRSTIEYRINVLKKHNKDLTYENIVNFKNYTYRIKRDKK